MYKFSISELSDSKPIEMREKNPNALQWTVSQLLLV